MKYFGLGPYFYVEFMRRICWLFFFLSLIEGVRIFVNSKSSGLSDYSVSFSTYLIPTTLGNSAFTQAISTKIPSPTMTRMSLPWRLLSCYSSSSSFIYVGNRTSLRKYKNKTKTIEILNLKNFVSKL